MKKEEGIHKKNKYIMSHMEERGKREVNNKKAKNSKQIEKREKEKID